jgi:hypothetical protein
MDSRRRPGSSFENQLDRVTRRLYDARLRETFQETSRSALKRHGSGLRGLGEIPANALFFLSLANIGGIGHVGTGWSFQSNPNPQPL